MDTVVEDEGFEKIKEGGGATDDLAFRYEDDGVHGIVGMMKMKYARNGICRGK